MKKVSKLNKERKANLDEEPSSELREQQQRASPTSEASFEAAISIDESDADEEELWGAGGFGADLDWLELGSDQFYAELEQLGFHLRLLFHRPSSVVVLDVPWYVAVLNRILTAKDLPENGAICRYVGDSVPTFSRESLSSVIGIDKDDSSVSFSRLWLSPPPLSLSLG